MRLHTYTAGSGAAITQPDVDPQTPLREIIVVEADEAVFRVGDEVEIVLDVTVVELFGDEPGHVIRHHCKAVAVTVEYGGIAKEVKAHPATRVSEVRKEAVKAFELDPATSADLVLRVPGSTEDLVATAPIGAYVPKGSCALTVDLVHVVRPQG